LGILGIESASLVHGAAFREPLMKVGYVVLYVNSDPEGRWFAVTQ